MGRGVTLAVFAVLALATIARAEDPGCVKCHGDESMDWPARVREPAVLYRNDVHTPHGVICSDCHGGNPDTMNFLEAHDRKKGWTRTPTAETIVALCSKCHDDADRMRELGAPPSAVGQGKQFRASVHGTVTKVAKFETPTCVSCHGSHGIRGKADPESRVHPSQVPETCARCHADLGYMQAFTSKAVRVDQLIAYRTSTHGHRLADGDVKVAVCSSCHGAHDILPASNPNSRVHPQKVATTCGRCHADAEYMKGYRITGPGGAVRPLPTNQLARYEQSVHHESLMEKGDLSAPTCNDCHGNHGATPPEFRTVAAVCSQCHSRPAELFDKSRLKEALDEAGYPECATCHGHHEIHRPDESLLDRIAAGDTPSGWEPDAGRREVASTFRTTIRRLADEIDDVESRIEQVENYGMDLTRARLRLSGAKDGLVRSRVIIHTFDPGKLEEIVKGTEDEAGADTELAAAARLAEEAFAERRFRRVGLAVALGLIVLMIVALLAKIRQLESGEASE